MLIRGHNVHRQLAFVQRFVIRPVQVLASLQQLSGRLLHVRVHVRVYLVVIRLLWVQVVARQKVHQLLILDRILHWIEQSGSELIAPLCELGHLVKVIDLVEFPQLVDLWGRQPNLLVGVGGEEICRS